MQIVPMLSEKMLLESESLLECAAPVVAEVAAIICQGELVLVDVALTSTALLCARMPLEKPFHREVSVARIALPAVADYRPVDLQGLLASRRLSVKNMIADELVELITLKQVCRLTAIL